jgi:peptide/nickel transport system substrate-binding protein
MPWVRKGDHHRVNPDFEEFQLIWPPEAGTRLAMVIAGEADAVILSQDPREVSESKGMKGIRGTIVVGSNHMMFGGNYLSSKPSYDPTVPWAAPGEVGRKVRQALNMAIDREELGDTLFFGEGEFTMMPFFHSTYLGWDLALIPKFKENYRYDPVRAKELLAEAGFPKGFKTTIALVPRPGMPNILDVDGAIAGYWKAIGLDVDTPSMEFSQVLELLKKEEMWNMSWIDATARLANIETSTRIVLWSESIAHWFESDFIDEKYEVQ